LLDAAAQAENAEQRYALLAQAEQLLLQESVVLPLLVDRGMELVSPRLAGYGRNARGLVDWAALSLKPESTP
jgi:ABC-type oligopeptide transport system substrate-binding subunit